MMIMWSKYKTDKYLDGKIKELNDIYNKIPELKCQENCHECCGATRWLPIEYFNIKRFLDNLGLKERNMKTMFEMCPYIEDNKCIIYPVRPIICRLFGVVNYNKTLKSKALGKEVRFQASMICPDVKIDNYLTTEESKEIMKKIINLIPDEILGEIYEQ